jgi:hypothetical protein
MFGKKGLKGAEFDAFLEELKAQPPMAVGGPQADE